MLAVLARPRVPRYSRVLIQTLPFQLFYPPSLFSNTSALPRREPSSIPPVCNLKVIFPETCLPVPYYLWLSSRQLAFTSNVSLTTLITLRTLLVKQKFFSITQTTIFSRFLQAFYKWLSNCEKQNTSDMFD